MASKSGSAPAPWPDCFRQQTPTTETFLATFADGGVVDDWGREFVGSDAIRGWSDHEFIGKHVSLDIRSIQRDGDATVLTAEVGGEGFNGPSHFSFPVDGARVSRMTIRA